MESGALNGTRPKVAMIQDQEIPKQDVERMLNEKGFDVLWTGYDEPSDAWAIVTDGRGRITDEVLAKHPNCKLLAVSFVGTNHIDHDACKKGGIAVVNAPDYSSSTVAELTIGLALSVYREIPAAERTIRCGGWVHSAGGMELRGKSIGIVGLGHIGLETAKLFSAFGPRELLGWSRRPKEAFASIGGSQVSLGEIFERADVISLAVLLTNETRGMITKELLEKLKPSSVLINIARAQLCDQEALVELLCQRRFRAGLDVFTAEPLPADDPMLKVPADQVVLVPHLGYKSFEALQRRFALTAENLRCYADGAPQNLLLGAE
mmetsp:Transcript_16660/g.34778  ORF Transcript_16660/g.34778 Transcript_16660/m.34778 type:complete len:321 (-) Transcript_16660:401-1363(-)